MPSTRSSSSRTCSSCRFHRCGAIQPVRAKRRPTAPFSTRTSGTSSGSDKGPMRELQDAPFSNGACCPRRQAGGGTATSHCGDKIAGTAGPDLTARKTSEGRKEKGEQKNRGPLATGPHGGYVAARCVGRFVTARAESCAAGGDGTAGFGAGLAAAGVMGSVRMESAARYVTRTSPTRGTLPSTNAGPTYCTVSCLGAVHWTDTARAFSIQTVPESPLVAARAAALVAALSREPERPIRTTV